MSGTWLDFDSDTALERDVLERCLPLTATKSDGAHRATIDQRANSVSVEVTLGTVANGHSPSTCVDLLQIRPLLTGSAWKVLDLLMEAALDAAGMTPSQGQRWRIDEKVRLARTGAVPHPAAIDPLAWTALSRTYAQTEQLRHSLVHRAVYADPSGSLVGRARSGGDLQPMTAVEQEALGRACLRAAELVISGQDPRTHDDLLRQLGYLVGLHGVSLTPMSDVGPLPEYTVIIDADPEQMGHYLLDVPDLRQRHAAGDPYYADLILHFRDRPGLELRGRLEDAPNVVVFVDPDQPPPWLRR